MQNQLPVLIFAQSARFIAESATRAGYTVWVADCFCDTDTLAVAERSLKIPPLSGLSEVEFFSALQTLSQGTPCALILGTGIERLYPLLNKLPDHIRYLGNTIQTLSLLRQAQLFFNLLDTLKLPYPEVSFSQPHSPDSNWLYKDLSGYGGQTIQATQQAVKTSNGYYQAFVDGQAASVCFLADGQQAIPLSFNEQQNLSEQFQLLQIYTPFEIPPQIKQGLVQALNEITQASGLKGLASLDFIIDNDDFYILEINPRFTASAELTRFQSALFQWHLQALHGELVSNHTVGTDKPRLLTYYYAEQDCVICAQPHWPESCHDLPAAATPIAKHHPVCTIIVEAETRADCEKALQTQRLLVQQNLLADS